MDQLTTAPGEQTGLLNSKTHYQVLDGLRGIAAISVVVFHFMEFAVPDYSKSFIAHGYLAVDFFFCLSGFVIAYAYDNRMAGLGIMQFFKIRLIRLQPLVFIGAILGLITFLFDPFHNLYAANGSVKTIMMLLSASFMIPYPSIPERYYNLFYFNPPTWSLFWEYIANIFYALFFWKMKINLHRVLTMAAAILLCLTAFHYNNLSAGWGVDNYAGGAARVLFSFLAGMIVYRSKWVIPNRLGFPAMGLLLMAAFLVPYSDYINRVTEPLIVIFYFPFLVALAAGTRLKPAHENICRFSGEISYPLYMIHYPLLWVFFSYMEMYKPSMSLLKIQIPLFTLLLIILAYLIMKYADIPMRHYLKERLNQTGKP